MKVCVVWDRFGPYHRARAQASAELFALRGSELVGLEVSGRAGLHQWESKPIERVGLYTLFPAGSEDNLSRVAVRRAIAACLDKIDPDAVALPAYSTAAAQGGLIWARRNNRRSVIMAESTRADRRRAAWKEWAKRTIVSEFDAALAGGSPQARYIQELGMPRERVFTPYDVVDNNYYALEARRVRAKPEFHARRLGISPNTSFFLASGRFISRKNFEGLVEAYGRYRHACTEAEPWNLVVLGDGPKRERIEKLAKVVAPSGSVALPGYCTCKEAAAYYGLATAFVHPATVDQWGLVINEAMAAGLPIVASNAAGATEDLVRDGENGYVFDPRDLGSLTMALRRIASREVSRQAMGLASLARIADWSLEHFAEGLWSAVTAPRPKRAATMGFAARAITTSSLVIPRRMVFRRLPSEQ